MDNQANLIVLIFQLLLLGVIVVIPLLIIQKIARILIGSVKKTHRSIFH